MTGVRIGVYVDAYNLYYGGRGACGRGTPGWRWLDIRALAESLVSERRNWRDAEITRIVYCTALIDARSNPGGHRDQDVYIKALKTSGSVDHVEYGNYVARVKKAPLATEGPKGAPELVRTDWPVMVRDAADKPVRDATFMVSYAFREEKGSDVNVASHLLIDALSETIDAAVVISNDSDLRYPITFARGKIPVGLVNPTGKYLAGALRGHPDEGAGRHWWRQLSEKDFRSHQLPDPAGGYDRPEEW